MEEKQIIEMSQEEFKKFVKEKKEDSYVLIDVREPEEYEEEHIPGSVLIPLREIETSVLELDPNKDFIFYCLSGKRSMVAAKLVLESGFILGKIFVLKGGILYWQGKALADYPKLEIIDISKDPVSLLKRAIELEKGTERFYKIFEERFKNKKLSSIAHLLSTFEKSHAKMIYSLLKKMYPDIESFDDLYNSLKGKIIEGGLSVDNVVDKVLKMEGNKCVNLCEMALEIEFMAYDLYKNIAVRESDPELIKIMFFLSEQEKLHVNSVSKMFSRCDINYK